MENSEPRPTAERPQHRWISILLGILFLIPAVFACGASQLALTIGTVSASLHKSSLIGSGVFIGLQNFTRLFQDKVLIQALGYTAQTMLERVLAVALVPLLLSWGASRLRRSLRLGLKLLFTLPVAIFSPVAVALMWSLFIKSSGGAAGKTLLATPSLVPGFLLGLDFVYTLGLACGVGFLFGLASFRDPKTNPAKPLFIAWGIGILAAIASSLQSFTFSYVITSGGPASATTNVAYYLFRTAFASMNFGYGAAIATLLIFLLAILGVIAGGLAIISGLKFAVVAKSVTGEATSQDGASARSRLIALILGLVGGMAALIVGLLPLGVTITTAGLSRDISALQKAMPLGTTLVNTLLPPIFSVLLLQFPLSYLAALGIGALRPLGRHSEWLLLPFTPWLFTGLVPLSIVILQLYRQVGRYGTLVGQIQPLALSVPILFILTLFFKGQTRAFQDKRAQGISGVRAFFVSHVFPSLPLAALFVIAGVCISIQNSFWSLVFDLKPAQFSANSALIVMQRMYTSALPTLAAGILSVWITSLLIVFLVFGVFQVFYLDRISLSAGREAESDRGLSGS